MRLQMTDARKKRKETEMCERNGFGVIRKVEIESLSHLFVGNDMEGRFAYKSLSANGTDDSTVL